jgi:predicted phosphodiesterase
MIESDEITKDTLHKLWSGVLKFAEIVGLREQHHASAKELYYTIKLRYGEFKNLLTANNELLEIIAELETLRRGDLVFGLDALKTYTRRAVSSTRQMVAGLQTISDNRYPGLRTALEKIELALGQELSERRPERLMEWVLPLREIGRSHAWQTGNKMANLGEIRNRVGLPTPDGFAITTVAVELFLQTSGVSALIRELLDQPSSPSLEEVGDHIQQAILSSAVPADLAVALVAAYDALADGSPDPPRVALRSSGVKEDSEASFAGQYTTVLNVRGAEAVLHCGDVVAPSTLNVLQPLGLPVHVIHGNNAGDLYMMARIASKPSSVVKFYGQDAGIELAGKRIFLVHYPHYAQAMATTGDWDIVCCGHDHCAAVTRVANIKGGESLVVNPGTVGGVAAPATYILGDLEGMTFEVLGVRSEE